MDSRLDGTKKKTATHLLLLELGPVLLVVDHEALGGLRVTHLVECENVCVVVSCIGCLDKGIAVSSQDDG
jgi:hypothetical protein